MESSIPDDWMADVEEAILKPELFKFTGFKDDDEHWSLKKKRNQTMIPAVLAEKFNLFNTRALAHSKTKGEHEIAATFNFYIIYKYKLWRAECDSWTEYTDYLGDSTFGVAKSTVEHDVLEIDKLLLKGLTVKNLISSMATAKGATKRLVTLPTEQLPNGDINQAAELLSRSSAHEAHKTVDDWEGKSKIFGLTSLHDSALNRLYFDVRITAPDGNWQKKDYMITDIERDVAEWILVKLQVTVNRRVYR